MEENLPLLLSCPVINPDILARLNAVLLPEDLRFLEQVGTVKVFHKKEVLVSSGEGMERLIFLRQGLARTVDTSHTGSERTFSYVAGGCFLAEAGFFHQQPILYNISFLEESQVLFIERKHLSDILRRPGLSLYLLVSISLMSRILAMQIEDQAFRSTTAKICRTLMCLNASERKQYKRRFTHQELADLAGMHRVTVTNALSALRKEGIIRSEGRGLLVVVDLERLKEKSLV